MIFHGIFANNHEGWTVVASQKFLLCYYIHSIKIIQTYFQLFNKLVQLTWQLVKALTLFVLLSKLFLEHVIRQSQP